MKLILVVGRAGFICLPLALFFGFAGSMHPAFDSLSLLRLPLAIACLLSLVFPMRSRLRLLLVAAVVLGTGSTVPILFEGKQGSDLSIYSKNIWFANRDLSALAQDIRASNADVVALQEVSQPNRRLLAALADIYPHQHICPFSGWSGVAVLARQPIVATACTNRRAVAAAQIELEVGRVWVASVHLGWPFPYNNAISAQSGAGLMETLDGPVIMAGDFNIFPWAASVKRLQNAANLQIAQPVRPTYQLGLLPFLLDHVHAP